MVQFSLNHSVDFTCVTVFRKYNVSNAKFRLNFALLTRVKIMGKIRAMSQIKQRSVLLGVITEAEADVTIYGQC